MDLEKFVLCFYEMPFPTFFTLNPVVSPTWALRLFSNAAPSDTRSMLLYCFTIGHMKYLIWWLFLSIWLVYSYSKMFAVEVLINYCLNHGQTICMIGVVERYKELSKFNLRQLTSPPEK